ncbi:MAG: hypothetical protein EBS35_04070 [Bacteroidetes bacterium]|nr:hypothetical protein [Bacteroidota bacterium]
MTRNYRDFYSIILVQFVVIQLVVIPIILLFKMNYLPHSWVGWMANLYFSLFSVIIFFMALKNLSISAGSAFIRIVMGGSGLKMAGAILVLSMVHLWYQPLVKAEVILFLIIYVIFTIFETYTLMKLSNH